MCGKILSLLYWIPFVPLWDSMSHPYIGLFLDSLLFSWSVYPFTDTIFIGYGSFTVSLKIKQCKPKTWFFFKFDLVFLDLLPLFLNLKISLSISTKYPSGIFVRISLNLWTTSWLIDISTVLNLSINEYSTSSHLFNLFGFFHWHFVVFSMWFLSFIPNYLNFLQLLVS